MLLGPVRPGRSWRHPLAGTASTTPLSCLRRAQRPLHVGLRLRLLVDRIERGGLVEVFDMFLPAWTDHLGSPHGTGVVERVFVHAGTITVGPASEPITLGAGDYARYSGDRPHVYRSADEDVHGMLLVGYPPA